MRVSIVYRDALQPGGYPRDIRWLAGALSEHGAEVNLVARAGPSVDGVGQAGVVPFHDPAEALNDADIVHLMGVMIPEQFDLLPTRDGVTTVVSPLAQLMGPHLMRHWWKKLPYAGYLRARLGRRPIATHVFSHEELAGASRFLPSQLTFTATVGIFPTDDRRMTGAAFEEPYLLFLGRNDIYQKGLDRLLDGFAAAVRQGFDQTLVIAGIRDGRSDEFLIKRSRALGVESRVRLLGAVDENQKWKLIEGARSLVFLSRWDGPPRPIREALSIGTPVVVSAGTNMAEMVERADAGASVGGASPASVAAALLRSGSRSTWGTGARDLAVELRWSNVALQYLAGYERAHAAVAA